MNADFKDFLENESDSKIKYNFKRNELTADNFKKIKRVNELHALLESYNDLAEK